MSKGVGRVVSERMRSRALVGNALEDPHVRDVPVYLPPGYDDSTRRYPVIFVLVGFGSSGQALLNFNGFGEPLDRRLDRLISRGAMKPCVVVMPDAFTALGGSQYIDSPGTGRYGRYLTKELVRFVDARFRTLPVARHRAVVGKSSGGYGALVHGMTHPDVFGALASHSGDVAFEHCYMHDFPIALGELERAGGVEPWLRKFRAAKKKSHAQIATLNIVAMTACYSPKRGLPLLCDFPFDLRTAAVREPVWRRWLAHDPLRMLPAHARALRSLRLVYLDAGRKDEWNLHLGARAFVDKARALGVKVVHEEFDDGHMDISYRYDVSLPLVSKAIS